MRLTFESSASKQFSEYARTRFTVHSHEFNIKIRAMHKENTMQQILSIPFYQLYFDIAQKPKYQTVTAINAHTHRSNARWPSQVCTRNKHEKWKCILIILELCQAISN